MLTHLFVTESALPCVDAADYDDGSTIDIADAISILDYGFSSGRPPAPPFPDFAEDHTGDDLSCCVYACP